MNEWFALEGVSHEGEDEWQILLETEDFVEAEKRFNEERFSPTGEFLRLRLVRYESEVLRDTTLSVEP